MAALADLAARRPSALLAPAIALAGVLVAIAIGTGDRLAVGSTRTAAGGRSAPDLVIVARGPYPATSRIYRVALDTILAGLRADPGVARAALGGSRGRAASVDVNLTSADEATRERAVERIAREIDPGPLTLAYGGEPRVLLDARGSVSGQLPGLELLALPFVALIAGWILGPAAAIGAAVAAAGAIAAGLVGLRIASAFASVALLGVAPGAVIGAAIAIELAALLRTLQREEHPLLDPPKGLRGILDDWRRLALPQALAAALVPLALLATPFPATGSIVVASAAAVLVAVALAAAAVPALLVLEARVWPRAAAEPRRRAGRVPRDGLARLARSRILLWALVGAAVIATIVLAVPVRDLRTRPLAAADLPAGSQALVAARREAGLALGGADAAARPGPATAPAPGSAATPSPAPATSDVVARLPIAAGIVLGGLAVLLVALARSPRALAAAPLAVLPAAAALGAATFVFADGHLAGTLGFAPQGSLDTGAATCAVTAVAAVGAGRCARDWLAVVGRRRIAHVAEAATHAADLVVPAVAAASLAVAAACGVLAGADLYPAREFGLIVAVGLVIDLVLRPPSVALLARIAPGQLGW